MSEADEDPYRRDPAPPAARGALQLGDAPLHFRTTRSERNRGAVGRGGWLIAVAVMLVWSALYNAALLTSLSALLASPELDAGKHAALRLAVLAGGAMFVLNLAVLVLYCVKSPWFPRAYIAWLSLDVIVFAIAIGLLTQAIGASLFGTAAAAAIARLLFWNGPWIAYAIVSERMRNTFVAAR